MMDIDQRLREFHEKAKPDSFAVKTLLNATVDAETRERKPLLMRSSSWLQQSWKFYFTTASIASVLFIVIGFSFHEYGSLNERIQRTVREVAMNHITRLEPEHKSDNVVALNRVMQQLPFSLKVPERIEGDYTLVGSRYCSLAGHLAAHVKLRNNSNGELISLFIAALEPELETMDEETQTVSGVDVELFNESDLFYALATQ